LGGILSVSLVLGGLSSGVGVSCLLGYNTWGTRGLLTIQLLGARCFKNNAGRAVC
jgi:hypothetical protein